MRLLLDIQDDKLPFIMELLSNFKFVKTRPLSSEKDRVLESIKESVEEVNLIKAGKKQAKPLSELLDEL